MTPRNSDYSESALVEKPAMDLFSQLGWSVQNCFHEFDPVSKYGAGEHGKSFLGRETKADVVLISKLKLALKKINPDISETVLDWRKKQQARASVKLCIEEILENLPPVFSTETYHQKCGLIYQHIYESYYGSGMSVYAYQS